jgi:hypothetical protein
MMGRYVKVQRGIVEFMTSFYEAFFLNDFLVFVYHIADLDKFDS